MSKKKTITFTRWDGSVTVILEDELKNRTDLHNTDYRSVEFREVQGDGARATEGGE